jgi:YHS domain-containing protein
MKTLMAVVAGLAFLVLAEDPANKKCPVAGKDIDAKQTVKHKIGEKEYLVAFCCGNCKGKFEKEPAKYEEALKKEIGVK